MRERQIDTIMQINSVLSWLASELFRFKWQRSQCNTGTERIRPISTNSDDFLCYRNVGERGRQEKHIRFVHPQQPCQARTSTMPPLRQCKTHQCLKKQLTFIWKSGWNGECDQFQAFGRFAFIQNEFVWSFNVGGEDISFGLVLAVDRWWAVVSGCKLRHSLGMEMDPFEAMVVVGDRFWAGRSSHGEEGVGWELRFWNSGFWSKLWTIEQSNEWFSSDASIEFDFCNSMLNLEAYNQSDGFRKVFCTLRNVIQ